MNPRALRRSDPEPMNRAQAKLALKTVVTEPLDSGVLFAGGSEVVICHGAEFYRLRLTRQNKLILTK
jgi:hemin uptake protein HemP